MLENGNIGLLRSSLGIGKHDIYQTPYHGLALVVLVPLLA